FIEKYILSERINASLKSTGPLEVETRVTLFPPQPFLPQVKPLMVRPSPCLIVPFFKPIAPVTGLITEPGAYVAAKRLTKGLFGLSFNSSQLACVIPYTN